MKRRDFLIRGISIVGTALFNPLSVKGVTSIPTHGKSSGILDRFSFDKSQTREKYGNRIVRTTWNIGERSIPVTGVQMEGANDKIAFTLDSHGVSHNLTVSFREYRAVNNGGIAYLLRINGKNIAFRNTRFRDAGITTSFMDIPNDLHHNGVFDIELINLASAPLLISEATLYADIESHAKQEEMIQPLTVYLTGGLDPKRIALWRETWSETPYINGSMGKFVD